MKVRQQKFVSGFASTGRVVLVREDKSTAITDVVIVRGASLTDNNNSTFDLVFEGS